METKKVSSKAIAKAATLRASSDVHQMAAQNVSPAILGGSQFQGGAANPQSAANLVPGFDAANQGVTGLYTPNPADWFWNNWISNAKANNMQVGTEFTEGGVMPKLGKVFLPEHFWTWAQSKQEQAFQEDFNRFVFSQVDVTTPAGRAYWEKKFPGYTQQVYNAWALKMQTQAKLAEIQIKGFQNEGDLWFAYLYQNGYMDRLLTPPTNRLIAVPEDEPQTSTTNNPTAGPAVRFINNAPTTQMPAIP